MGSRHSEGWQGATALVLHHCAAQPSADVMERGLFCEPPERNECPMEGFKISER